VIEQIQLLGSDPRVLEEMLTTVRQEDEARVAEWENERVSLERDLLRGQSEVRTLLAEVGAGTSSNAAVARLAQMQTRLAQIEQRFAALLKGLLRCLPCGCAMTPSHTTRKGGLRYRYYTCVQAQKSGWQTCPSKSIPAQPIEQLVIEQIQRLSHDPVVLEQLLTTVRQEDEARVAAWESERVALQRDLLRGQNEVRRLLAEVGSGTSSNAALTRLAELQARLGQIEQRLARLRGQMEVWQQERLDQAAATEALAGLVPAWQTMSRTHQRGSAHHLGRYPGFACV